MSLLNNGDDNACNGAGDEGDQDHHYEPIIYLPEITPSSNEEGESVLIQLRAKLFRHDKVEKLWKERGTGEVKLLHNEDLNTVRVVMRRDKTLKICANHYVTTDMELKSNCGSDRAWVWSTLADVADGEPNPEVLAIRFQNADAAKKWKDTFEEAKSIVANSCDNENEKNAEDNESVDSEASEPDSNSEDEVSKEVSKLTLTSETQNQENEVEKGETQINSSQPGC